jgi:hypothetical protein
MSDPDRHLRDAFREALKLTEWTDDKEQEATFERTREHIRKYLRTPEGDGEVESLLFYAIFACRDVLYEGEAPRETVNA